MKPELFISGLILLVLLLPKKEKKVYSIKDFVKEILPIATAIEKKYGIKKEFLIAQAGLESNYGNSKLTKIANNLFGLTGVLWKKQGKPIVELSTKEYIGGKWVTKIRPFRKYTSWYESAEDYAKLIATSPRYRNVYREARYGTVRSWAEAMQLSGYATDPEYGRKLVMVYRTIKKYV